MGETVLRPPVRNVVLSNCASSHPHYLNSDSDSDRDSDRDSDNDRDPDRDSGSNSDSDRDSDNSQLPPLPSPCPRVLYMPWRSIQIPRFVIAVSVL